VLELVQAHAARGAIVVLGNHDAAALGRMVPGLNSQALAAIAWTRPRLTKGQLAFLEALPTTVREDDRLFVHASAAVPERWTYVSGVRQATMSMEAANATMVFCGHVHEQRLYFMGEGRFATPFRPMPGTPIPTTRQRRWLAIIGSAGQPRDRNTAACYALADLGRERITFYRVPYDFELAAQKIRRAGLPERLARRLERGV
jgi:diadenosine tetraphosphatase ApaH/serine/threonine PP2A family protein phosphatase